jgi:2-phospho-L-lactate guanylyltransferase
MKDVQAIIPVASLDRAKSRLRPILSLPERAQLVLCMLEDLSSVLLDAENIEGVIVISPDTKVTEYATVLGLNTILESNPSDLNRALNLATREIMANQSNSSSLILPVDIPLLKTTSIQAISSMDDKSEKLVIAAQSNNGGTNLLFQRPPNVIDTAFGPGSFSKHRTNAFAKGIPFQEWSSPDTKLDIDTSEDVYEFMKIGKGTKTWNYLNFRLTPF